MPTFAFRKREHFYFFVGIGAFLLTVLFVNPFRETAMGDDYAYALTVRHLVETGEYQLHDWVAPNMPFLAYWSALFCRIFGYSFTTLRISALVLTFLGLIGFYFLAREHDLEATPSGLLMLGLFAGPLVLYLSFSFVTDVPFLACLSISLLFYSRALRLRNYSSVLLGSVFASAAILIRQPGLAIPAGLFVLWLLQEDRIPRLPLFLAGLTLPVLAGIWQIAAAIGNPTWSARDLMVHQTNYLNAKSAILLQHMFWRSTVILQYLALFTLPFVFLACVGYLLERKEKRTATLRHSRFGKILLLILLTAYLAAGILHGHLRQDAPFFMPYLPWHFWLLELWPGFRIVLTIATSIGGILLAYAIILRYSRSQWNQVPANQRLLDSVTLFLLLFCLLFMKMGDKYILVLLPFALIVMGRFLSGYLRSFSCLAAIACFVVLIVSALWTRGLLAHAEAIWKACELVRTSGVDPRKIAGPWTWISYYSFEDYLRDIGYGVGDDRISDFFYRWLPERSSKANFAIADFPPNTQDRWRVVAEVPFRGILLRSRRVYAYQKIP